MMDERVRVQGAKLDDLQAVMAAIKNADLDFSAQFTNYK